MRRITLLSFLLLAASVAAGSSPPFVSFEEAGPILSAMREALPAGLAGLSDDRLAATWPAWVRERDRAVRDRLARGEEDAVVNLLFFGTSFTKAPRLTTAALGGTAPARGGGGRRRQAAGPRRCPGPTRGRRAAPARPLGLRAGEAEGGRHRPGGGRGVADRRRRPGSARAGRLRGGADAGPGAARRDVSARRALDPLSRPRDRPRHVSAARVRPRRGPAGRAGARPPHRGLRPPGRGRGPRARLRGEGRGPGLLPAAVDAGARPRRLARPPRPVAPREPLGHGLRHQPARARPPGAGSLAGGGRRGLRPAASPAARGMGRAVRGLLAAVRRRGRGPGRGGEATLVSRPARGPRRACPAGGRRRRPPRST